MENTPKKRATASKQKQPALSLDALAELLTDRIAESAMAVTPQQLLKHLKAQGHVTAVTDIAAALDGLVNNELVYRHPGASGAKGPSYAYGRERPEAYVAEQLHAFIRTEAELSLKSLRAAVPKAYLALADEAIGELLRDKKLFEMPGGGKTKKYSSKSPPPTAVLTPAHRKSLEAILVKLNPMRSSALQLGDLLAFLDGTSQSPPATTPAQTDSPLTLDQLIEFYKLDLPGQHGLTSMPVPTTWRRYVSAKQSAGGQADRAAFERLLLDSAARGSIELSPHEWPAQLSPDEAAAAIVRSNDQVLYYWRPLEA